MAEQGLCPIKNIWKREAENKPGSYEVESQNVEVC